MKMKLLKCYTQPNYMEMQILENVIFRNTWFVFHNLALGCSYQADL